MAISKVVIASLLISCIVLGLLTDAEARGAHKLDCGRACAYRCSKSWKPKMCLRACGSCCARCHCVPPGPTANRDICPCYAKIKTHGGRYKCP